ncbi:MAG: hypothetical protein IPL50_19220 [Chitinophagaceae bacterium]|nr:hypothetical protein [Chitinophagaceae bacterium]
MIVLSALITNAQNDLPVDAKSSMMIVDANKNAIGFAPEDLSILLFQVHLKITLLVSVMYTCCRLTKESLYLTR